MDPNKIGNVSTTDSSSPGVDVNRVYPTISSALGEFLRKTSAMKVDDYKLIPVDVLLYNEVKIFLTQKYGGTVTRETLMLNGHLITPKSPGDVTK